MTLNEGDCEYCSTRKNASVRALILQTNMQVAGCLRSNLCLKRFNGLEDRMKRCSLFTQTERAQNETGTVAVLVKTFSGTETGYILGNVYVSCSARQ